MIEKKPVSWDEEGGGLTNENGPTFPGSDRQKEKQGKQSGSKKES